MPWPAQATLGWLLELLIPFRRENVKLEQIQRRAAGMGRVVKNMETFPPEARIWAGTVVCWAPSVALQGQPWGQRVTVTGRPVLMHGTGLFPTT